MGTEITLVDREVALQLSVEQAIGYRQRYMEQWRANSASDMNPDFAGEHYADWIMDTIEEDNNELQIKWLASKQPKGWLGNN